MDPLDPGDSVNLAGVFDTITGTVNSVQNFGQTVGEATTFDMSVAMIWAVILFMFLTLFSRLAKPWNDSAAERWRESGHIRRPPAVPFHRRGVDPQEQRILDLEDRLAAALATIAALTAEESPPPSRETASADR